MDSTELRKQIQYNGIIFWGLAGALGLGAYGCVTTATTDMVPPFIVGIFGGTVGAAVGAVFGSIVGSLWARLRHGA